MVVDEDGQRLIPARAGKTLNLCFLGAPVRAHPRAGGENIPAKFRPSQEQGSSPRGRGKQTRDEREPFFPRLIPARAGKTAASWLGQVAVSAHPRAGGENLTPAGRLVIDGGSSPRGRGKHRAGARVREHPGLIPARAGKTSIGRATSRVLPGSSPRGRGKPVREARRVLGGRLIPARAGKTSFLIVGELELGAHPRAGGENPLAI